jgi:hypothetical protein
MVSALDPRRADGRTTWMFLSHANSCTFCKVSAQGAADALGRNGERVATFAGPLEAGARLADVRATYLGHDLR